MSSPRRVSSRAAIGNWLTQVGKASSKDGAHKTAFRNQGDGGRSSVERVPDIGSNLAAQLNLHTPFRSFATRGADAQIGLPHEFRQRKRRRIGSSTSSYLEPAFGVDESGKIPGDPKGPKNSRRLRQSDNRSASNPTSSLNSTIVSPKKPAKSYEKRSRHKTKEDRYELKQDKRRAKARTDEGKGQAKPKKKKRKGQERSGAALMQNFSARNVEPERLTVSSNLEGWTRAK
ncbi:MAG: hypothetical protein Q9222_003426 [Ikaeria aurantiellina]